MCHLKFLKLKLKEHILHGDWTIGIVCQVKGICLFSLDGWYLIFEKQNMLESKLRLWDWIINLFQCLLSLVARWLLSNCLCFYTSASKHVLTAMIKKSLDNLPCNPINKKIQWGRRAPPINIAIFICLALWWWCDQPDQRQQHLSKCTEDHWENIKTNENKANVTGEYLHVVTS